MKYLALLPRFRRAYRELDSLAARETWSRSAIEEFQLAQINNIWRSARSDVAYYRELADEHSLPPQFASMGEFRERMPLLPRSVLRKDTSRFVSASADKGGWYRTGGSTGSPMRVFRAREAHQRRLWAQYRFFQTWNIDILDRTVHLWGHGSSRRGGMKGHVDRCLLPVYDGMRNRLRLSAYSVSPARMREYLQQMADFQPCGMYAYSSAAYLLAREALASEMHCDSLRAVVLTSEPAFAHIVAAVEQAFRVPAVIEYGSIEGGFFAGEAPDRTLRVREDYVFMETLPYDGNRFQIVITSLTNPSFPLFRYAIGDLTSSALQYPGRGFAILKDVVGRENQTLRSSSGRFLHSAWFEEIVEQHPGIRRYRLHQQVDGSLDVQLELDPGSAAFSAAPLQKRLREQLEGFPVNVTFVEELESSLSGKHTWITSDMS
jgi:phenylacetate-CoA ligase